MAADNQMQIDLWKGRVGDKWAALRPQLDAMLAAVTAELAARVGPVAGLRVLDIGCGTGVTCAIWLAGGADVTGVDVSTPMLAVARDRSDGKARLIEADAAVWRDSSAFDLAVSQFGVMFFADPQSAFANIAANIRPGGRLVFACWRPVGENPWATLPMSAVRDLLPPQPVPAPNAPGPFALGDRDRLRDILDGAGLAGIVIAPFDFPVVMADAGGIDRAVQLLLQIGPAAAALGEADDAARAAAPDRFRTALAPHQSGGRVTLGGAVWLVEAVRAG
jgi:SAM-dependent methyltransferase